VTPLSPASRPGLVKISKVVLFVSALVPWALLVRGVLTNNLGANPAETIQLTTGRWAFKFLLVTLAVTPVRRLTKWNILIQYRRMLGLFAFFYATCHLAAYYAFDLDFSLAKVVGDTLKRPFIFMGMAAFLTMLPLALTSTKGWIRRLGKKWTLLHRLIYLTAICAAVHFAWKVKVFAGDAVLYAIVVAILLGFRLVWTLTHARPRVLRYGQQGRPA
jgi:methionine sulfoxide reductase heme-binding subunit